MSSAVAVAVAAVLAGAAGGAVLVCGCPPRRRGSLRPRPAGTVRRAVTAWVAAVRRHGTELVVVAAGALVSLGTDAPVPVLLALAVAVPVRRSSHRRLAERDARRAEGEVVRLCEVFAAELRAGRMPQQALERALGEVPAGPAGFPAALSGGAAEGPGRAAWRALRAVAGAGRGAAVSADGGGAAGGARSSGRAAGAGRMPGGVATGAVARREPARGPGRVTGPPDVAGAATGSGTGRPARSSDLLDRLGLLAAARYGGDVPAALREAAVRPGAEGLAGLAACWQVASGSGAGFTAGVERLARGLREARALREELRAQLAAPRATAILLACLPLFGVVLGTAMGAAPVRVLLHTAAGSVCLVLGLLLEWGGLAWTAALARRAADHVGAGGTSPARPRAGRRGAAGPRGPVQRAAVPHGSGAPTPLRTGGPGAVRPVPIVDRFSPGAPAPGRVAAGRGRVRPVHVRAVERAAG